MDYPPPLVDARHHRRRLRPELHRRMAHRPRQRALSRPRSHPPFLLGLLLALYGWERLRSNGSAGQPIPGFDPPNKPVKGRWWISLLILLIGLAIAAVMRPTFWILAIAWMIVCMWGLIAGPRRR